MSNLDFELDINKYTVSELEKLLNIKFPYSIDTITESISLLHKKIMSDKELEPDKQNEILNFLRKTDQRLNKALLEKKNKMQQNVITQYNSNFIIDRNSQRERDPNGVPPAVKINPYRTGPGDTVSLLSGWEDGTTTHLLSIDSRFRNQYFETTSTDFLVTLPLSVTNVVSMQLVALEIPSTYFSISKRLGNNFFHVWVAPPLQMLYKITLPDGNYSRTQMQDMINLMFLAAGFPGSIMPQASIDKISGRIIIDLGDQKNIYFNLMPHVAENGPKLTISGTMDVNVDASEPIQIKLGWVLGFRAAAYLTTATTPFVFVGEGIYDGWGSRYFYFVVDDFNKNSVNGINAILNSSVISDNILARLTRSSIGSALNLGFTLDSSLLKSDSATRKRVYFGPVNIKKLRFRILDAYGRVIDLNNMDISFALRLDRLYD
jgi:hypothetical protein